MRSTSHPSSTVDVWCTPCSACVRPTASEQICSSASAWRCAKVRGASTPSSGSGRSYASSAARTIAPPSASSDAWISIRPIKVDAMVTSHVSNTCAASVRAISSSAQERQYLARVVKSSTFTVGAASSSTTSSRANKRPRPLAAAESTSTLSALMSPAASAFAVRSCVNTSRASAHQRVSLALRHRPRDAATHDDALNAPSAAHACRSVPFTRRAAAPPHEGAPTPRASRPGVTTVPRRTSPTGRHRRAARSLAESAQPGRSPWGTYVR